MTGVRGGRMARCFLLAALGLVSLFRTVYGAGASPAASVESRDFETKSLPPAFHPPKEFAEGYKLFKAGGAYLPEGMIVQSVLIAGQGRLGVTKEATEQLRTALEQTYSSIAADPLLGKIPSALPYCLSDERPKRGHYFACYPPKFNADAPVIVFLHGYGGNFLFYTYLLKEEFPDAVILVPSWSASWHDGTQQYLDDMYSDVQRRKSFTVRKPRLMAISAGGPAGFRLYNQQPERFSNLVSIASAPARATVPELKADLKILMLNGKKDAGFPIAAIESVAAQLSKRLPQFRFHVLDADHFFLLSERKETFRVVKEFWGKDGA